MKRILVSDAIESLLVTFIYICRCSKHKYLSFRIMFRKQKEMIYFCKVPLWKTRKKEVLKIIHFAFGHQKTIVVLVRRFQNGINKIYWVFHIFLPFYQNAFTPFCGFLGIFFPWEKIIVQKEVSQPTPIHIFCSFYFQCNDLGSTVISEK